MIWSNKASRPVFPLFVGLFLAGCGSDDVSGPGDVSRIEVTPATYTLASLGDTHQYSARARNVVGNELTSVTFTWSSSDTEVATVDDGLAIAVGNGTATITATAQGVSGDAALQVSQAVASVEVTPEQYLLIEFSTTFQFDAEARDANDQIISGATFLWSTSDENVATVNNSTGEVTAVGAGDVTITATAEDVDGSAALIVEVFTQISAGERHTVALTSREDGRSSLQPRRRRRRVDVRFRVGRRSIHLRPCGCWKGVLLGVQLLRPAGRWHLRRSTRAYRDHRRLQLGLDKPRLRPLVRRRDRRQCTLLGLQQQRTARRRFDDQ